MKNSLVVLLLSRSGLAFAGGPPTPAPAPAPAPTTPAAATAPAAAPTDVPFYFGDKVLTEADVKGKSLTELAKMRNTIFARAHQVFRKRWIHDYFATFAWYSPTGFEPKMMSDADKKNSEFLAKYEKAIPRKELLERRAALEKQPDSEDRKLETALLARALGIRIEGAADGDDLTPLDDPNLLDQQLTVEELKNLSRSDLRLVRNMVYAPRGRAFKSADLQAYFGRMDWYKVDSKYTDKKLTKLDNKNINLIKSVEDSLGGLIENETGGNEMLMQA
jgi:hypothetical protein